MGCLFGVGPCLQRWSFVVVSSLASSQILCAQAGQKRQRDEDSPEGEIIVQGPGASHARREEGVESGIWYLGRMQTYRRHTYVT